MSDAMFDRLEANAAFGLDQYALKCGRVAELDRFGASSVALRERI